MPTSGELFPNITFLHRLQKDQLVEMLSGVFLERGHNMAVDIHGEDNTRVPLPLFIIHLEVLLPELRCFH